MILSPKTTYQVTDYIGKKNQRDGKKMNKKKTLANSVVP